MARELVIIAKVGETTYYLGGDSHLGYPDWHELKDRDQQPYSCYVFKSEERAREMAAHEMYLRDAVYEFVEYDSIFNKQKTIYEVVRETLDDYNKQWRAATGNPYGAAIKDADVVAQNIVLALGKKPDDPVRI